MLDALYSNQSLKFLKKIDKQLAGRIIQKIESLQQDTSPTDVKVIEGYKEKLFRVRVGDYRILFTLNHDKGFVGIVKIDKRSRVYK
ncbi:MAG: type II toxin-antitoxin system RelE/ParE family toxin [Candidatus Woesearchaeota archaeon]